MWGDLLDVMLIDQVLSVNSEKRILQSPFQFGKWVGAKEPGSVDVVEEAVIVVGFEIDNVLYGKERNGFALANGDFCQSFDLLPFFCYILRNRQRLIRQVGMPEFYPLVKHDSQNRAQDRIEEKGARAKLKLLCWKQQHRAQVLDDCSQRTNGDKNENQSGIFGERARLSNAILHIEADQEAEIADDHADDHLQDDALAQIGPNPQRIIRDAQGKADAEDCRPVLIRLPETQSHVRDV